MAVDVAVGDIAEREPTSVATELERRRSRFVAPVFRNKNRSDEFREKIYERLERFPRTKEKGVAITATASCISTSLGCGENGNVTI